MTEPTVINLTTKHSLSQRMQRIRHLSCALAALCLAASVLLPAAMFAFWIATPATVLFSQIGLGDAISAEIGLTTRLLAFSITMVPLGAVIYGFSNARRCFAAFTAGELFSVKTVGSLRAFAVAMAASAILKPFAGAALSVLLSWNAAPGQKTLAFQVGSDTLVVLIFAGTVAVIAWVMTEAIVISDENASFV